MRTALTLNPKMMTYSRIDRTNMEVEIEKGIVKQRYENMRKSKQEQEQDEESDNETFDLEVENQRDPGNFVDQEGYSPATPAKIKNIHPVNQPSPIISSKSKKTQH